MNIEKHLFERGLRDSSSANYVRINSKYYYKKKASLFIICLRPMFFFPLALLLSALKYFGLRL